jgi:hypothetical protein
VLLKCFIGTERGSPRHEQNAASLPILIASRTRHNDNFLGEKNDTLA